MPSPDEPHDGGEPTPDPGERSLPAEAVTPAGSNDTTDMTDAAEPDGPDEPEDPAAAVEVIEPPIPDRVRRPADAVRLVVVTLFLVLGFVLADLAVGTRGAVEQDLAEATGGLPRILLTLLAWLSGLGAVLLPIAVGADLLVRRRPLQLVQALGAAVVGGILVIICVALVTTGHGGFLTDVLSRPTSSGQSPPLDIVVVSMIALLTVADIAGRKWISPIATAVVAATVLTTFLSGLVTLTALICSLLLGWLVGLAFRVGFGAVSTRPPGVDVARVLLDTGVPLERLRLVDANAAGDRRYAGTTESGSVDVHVIDRDTFGLASGRRLLRAVRLRSGFSRPPAVTLRAELEHRTLMGLLLADAGIHAPRPVAVSEVGPFAAVIAYVEPQGVILAELDDLDDEQLAQVWRLVQTLHRRRIAHRGLSRRAVLIDAEGRVGLRTLGAGDLAADDITLRIDLAQLLTSVAIVVGPQRAVSSAVDALGKEAVVRAVPVLQSVALTPDTRSALKERRGLLGELRDELMKLRPSTEEVAPVELRRVTLRSVVTLIGGVVAGYLVLTQLAQVNFGEVISTAQWEWVIVLVVFAAATFAGASIALAGAVQIHLRFIRTYMTQLAVAFSGLVAPAAVGNIALNTRYLQTSGLPPAVAGASVGVAQVAQFCSYFVLLVVAGVLAGTGPAVSFSPSPVLVAGVLAVVIIAIGLLAVPKVRSIITDRVMPQIRSAVPQVLATFQHPKKVAQLLGGALLLDLSFVASLVCATRAFGSDAAIPAVAVVYFAGAIIGSAVPTPGGLGGIEAAMSAGLIAIGVPGGTAVSAVLLYRLATYWLPIPFGWFSLNRLQRLGAI